MDSYILETLPGIHGILIGIGVAFFSAFAMYAYQKLQETKDQLDKTITDVEAFSTPNNYINGNNTLINSDGELDWDGKAKQLIKHAKSIYAHLDYEEKYGMPKYIGARSPSNDDVLNTCRDLCLMFHFLFVTYPFSGRSVIITGVTDKVDARKSAPFDLKRLKEIERRISFLNRCWETNNLSIIALARQATIIETMEAKKREMEAEKRGKESFEKCIKEMPDSEKERSWAKFHQIRRNQVRRDLDIDYAQILSEYFNKVFMYRDNVLPKLRDMIKVHDTFNRRFHVKYTTIYAIKILVYVFLFGVLSPMVLVELAKGSNLLWMSWLPYFLLISMSLLLYTKKLNL